MNKFEQELDKELETVGAQERERRFLLSLAKKLTIIERPTARAAVKEEILNEILRRESMPLFSGWIRKPALSLSFLAFFLGTGTVVASQRTIPGDRLYPIKQWSEEVRTKVQPSFREKLPVLRSREVKQLIEHRRDEKLLEKTLQKYREDVKALGKEAEPHGEKDAKIEESVKILEEAKEKAPEKAREKIQDVLDKVEQETQEKLNESLPL
jgi:hypothetical protein